MKKPVFSRRSRFILLLICLAAPAAFPCSTPVYRWALERWTPDPYTLFVYYETETPPAVVENFEARFLGDASSQKLLNLLVTPVHLSANQDTALKLLWEAQSNPLPPWLVLRYPKRPLRFPDAYHAPLTEAGLEALATSPKREAIINLLAEGHAGVWLLLESGESKADTAAYQRLERCLAGFPAYVAQLKHPDQGMAEILTSAAAYGLLRIQRDDPREKILVDLLLGTEPDLKEYAAPIAFPIFGRGRVLYALIGKGITEETIREACLYLSTSCSCEIKDQNPGTDLLLQANWPALVEALPELDVAITPPSPTSVAGPAPLLNTSPWWALIFLFSSAVVASLACFAWIAVLQRSKRNGV